MKKDDSSVSVAGSFRDPSGFLFFQNGELYRQINNCYKEDYNLLMQSGLYEELSRDRLLIPHQEVELKFARQPDISFKVIQPELLKFISYPYEWSFSQLKDAALLTLEIQQKALNKNLSLKDCSAYNVQFLRNRPVFIDTLSFEQYKEGDPWVAYRQFCQHFLAPLALMAYRDIRLNQLFRIYIDGVPLDLASSFLPFKTIFSFGLLAHIHLHAKSQGHFADKKIKIKKKSFSRNSFLALIDNLQKVIGKLKWLPYGTEWAEYYDDTNYSDNSFEHKNELINNFIDQVGPTNVWDLGANMGVFSQIPEQKGIPTIAFDIDPAAIEKLYLDCRKKEDSNMLPLLMDLSNPSAALGWANTERMSFIERGPVDTVMALALIHHLAIGNNVPLSELAGFFSSLCNNLIIEFVPKEDSQVERLLVSRSDIFDTYTIDNFEEEFKRFFTIEKRQTIGDSLRTLYLMKKKSINIK